MGKGLGLLVCLLAGCGGAPPAAVETRAPNTAPASRPVTAADCERRAGKVEAAIRQADGQVVEHVRALVRALQTLREQRRPARELSRCRAVEQAAAWAAFHQAEAEHEHLLGLALPQKEGGGAQAPDKRLCQVVLVILSTSSARSFL